MSAGQKEKSSMDSSRELKNVPQKTLPTLGTRTFRGGHVPEMPSWMKQNQSAPKK